MRSGESSACATRAIPNSCGSISSRFFPAPSEGGSVAASDRPSPTTAPTADTAAEDEETGQLDGKIAIVTGTSRGVGVGISRRLLEEAATVVVCSRRELPALPAAEGIYDDGGERSAQWVCDQQDIGQIDAFVQRVVDTRFAAAASPRRWAKPSSSSARDASTSSTGPPSQWTPACSPASCTTRGSSRFASC